MKIANDNSRQIWETIRFNRESLRQWQAKARSHRNEYFSSPSESLVEVLRSIIFFLAKGAGHYPLARTWTLDKRAWILLYALAPELVGNESMNEAGRRFGCSNQGLSQLLDELRSMLPELHVDALSRRLHNSDRDGIRERRSAGMRRSHATRRELRQRLEAFAARGKEAVFQ